MFRDHNGLALSLNFIHDRKTMDLKRACSHFLHPKNLLDHGHYTMVVTATSAKWAFLKGAIIVPARLRKRFRIEEGTMVTAEEREDGILIRGARRKVYS